MVDEQDRIRPHIRLYVNTSEVQALSQPVRSGDRRAGATDRPYVLANVDAVRGQCMLRATILGACAS